ncbi:MAG: acetylxylan esterase [Bryobacteraceae bacterium]|nr:acetylxylan esterase [Bryobacteraceae bacterium]
MKLSRRQFQWFAAGAIGHRPAATAQTEAAATQSHIGNLYPFVQKQADRSPLELSYLRSEFKALKPWQEKTRALVLDRLLYRPAPVQPDAQLIRRTERDDYVEEYLTFQTTPDIRVPAFVLIPKKGARPAPGIVALHDHGGFYFWGKEKLLEQPGEHPELTAFRRQYYGGRSTSVELVRRGYVVVVIDMFYWGERRMLLDDDPQEFRTRPADMPKEQLNAFNRRSGASEQLVARSLFTAGVSWPGVMLWDDIRTVDYLASRPEVDKNRLGCVGLSVGGYRSFMLAALDPRIKAGVDVGWMTSFGSQIRRHVINSVGLTFHIPGLYRSVDLPDLAGLIAPRAILVINGARDGLFAPEGVKSAFEKIPRIYEKAGAVERQSCRMYDGPHEFNPEMQEVAWKWLERWV